MLQIDDERTPRAEEVFVQRFFQLAQRHTHGVNRIRVYDDVIALGLRPDDAVNGQPHKRVLLGQRDDVLLPPEPVSRPVQHGKELGAIDGLEQIVERLHVVAVGDIVGIAGQEDDLHVGIAPPHAFGQLYAVHSAHFDIEQQYVVAPVFIIREEIRRGGKAVYIERLSAQVRPVARHALRRVERLGRVVADRHAIGHASPSPPIDFASIIAYFRAKVNCAAQSGVI